jgi:membrane-associated phospholipid phosphatase
MSRDTGAVPPALREPSGIARPLLRAHDAWQRLVARLFFGGRHTPASEALSRMTGNVFLIVVVFFIVLNTILYDWTGSLYTQGFHLNTALDNIIPFAPAWVIFYLYLFYPLSALTMAWFAFVEFRRGYALAWSLIIVNFIADAFYCVFPVTTDIYRAELLAHPLTGNPFAAAMYAHFKADPSFNCFPSLHAAIATLCFYAWHRYARVRPNRLTRGIAIGMLVVAVGVILSTLFVKQHYIADEIAGILLALGIGKWLFDAFGTSRTAFGSR